MEHADRNSDGTVNRQEFMSVIRAWYLMEGEKEERCGVHAPPPV